MAYREPKRLSRVLQIMSAVGGGFSGLGLILLIVFYLSDYAMSGPPQGGSSQYTFAFGIIFIGLDVALNLVAQIPLVLWARRLSLNHGQNGSRMVAAFVLPQVNIVGPAVLLSRLSPRLGVDRMHIIRWWLLKQAASPLIFLVTAFMLTVMMTLSGANFPLQTLIIFGPLAVVSLGRNFLGWRLVGRLSRADRQARFAVAAVDTF